MKESGGYSYPLDLNDHGWYLEVVGPTELTMWSEAKVRTKLLMKRRSVMMKEWRVVVVCRQVYHNSISFCRFSLSDHHLLMLWCEHFLFVFLPFDSQRVPLKILYTSLRVKIILYKVWDNFFILRYFFLCELNLKSF